MYDYGTDPSSREESFDYQEIHTGQVPLVSDPIVLKQGQGVLRRGHVLGRITETKKWVVSVAAANDGSEVPRRVLAFSVDTTAADVPNAAAYHAGQFIAPALTFGAGHGLQTCREAWEGTPLSIVSAS